VSSQSPALSLRSTTNKFSFSWSGNPLYVTYFSNQVSHPSLFSSVNPRNGGGASALSYPAVANMMGTVVTVAQGAVTVVVVVVVGAVVAMTDVPSPVLFIAGSKTSEGSEVAADVDAAGCSTGDDADVVRNSGAT